MKRLLVLTLAAGFAVAAMASEADAGAIKKVAKLWSKGSKKLIKNMRKTLKGTKSAIINGTKDVLPSMVGKGTKGRLPMMKGGKGAKGRLPMMKGGKGAKGRLPMMKGGKGAKGGCGCRHSY